MKATYHLLVSTVLSIIFIQYDNQLGAITCVLSGVFIDVDHLLDFYLIEGRITFSAKELVDTLVLKDYFFCPLHSIEIIAMFPIVFGYTRWINGIVVGMTFHLIFDLFTNNIHPLNLFLTTRILNKYKRMELLWKS